MRIVSLLPSATEILCALGLEERLVGVTHSCDYPPSVARLPRVTRTTIPPDASSAEIDRLVRERHRAGQPIYELDVPLIERLRPDLLVTQGLCEVCAVPDRMVEAAACALPGVPQVISQAPTRLGDVFANILELADRTGVSAAGLAVVGDLQRRITAVRDGTRRLPTRRRVTLLEWVDPLYACGHWTPELVELAGGVEGHGRPGQRSRRITWDEVRAWAPEVLVTACCGLDRDRTMGDVEVLRGAPGFRELPCALAGRVYVVDGDACFSRPGPRLVRSLELLAHLLHPDHFPAVEEPEFRVEVAPRT